MALGINNTVVIAKIVHKRKAVKLPVIVNASISKIKNKQIIYFIWTKISFIVSFNFNFSIVFTIFFATQIYPLFLYSFELF